MNSFLSPDWILIDVSCYDSSWPTECGIIHLEAHANIWYRVPSSWNKSRNQEVEVMIEPEHPFTEISLWMPENFGFHGFFLISSWRTLHGRHSDGPIKLAVETTLASSSHWTDRKTRDVLAVFMHFLSGGESLQLLLTSGLPHTIPCMIPQLSNPIWSIDVLYGITKNSFYFLHRTLSNRQA